MTLSMVRKLNARSADYQRWSNGAREVVFFPMIHVGHAEFYADVKRRIDSMRALGYVVYYEGVERSPIEPDSLRDLYERKFRKMMGLRLDTSGYASAFHHKGLLKDLVDQPRGSELGLNETDTRADVSLKMLVDAYEVMYGTIALENTDRELPLNGDYPPTIRLPQKNVQSVILGFRNDYLAALLHRSDKPRIIVVYGLAHEKGTLESLIREDPRWKRTE